MNIFELEIWDDEAKRCTFYTVREEGAEQNETDAFFEKYENDDTYREQIQELLSFVLDAIGDRHGAVDELFNRYENEVAGLPSHGRLHFGEVSYYFPNFPLRLYALKITNEIVILFGGGIKDGGTNQESSLHYKWVEACNYAKRIIQSLNDGTLIISEKDRALLLFNGSSDIIL
ncbi:MAG TPA: hypothetical protein VKX40_03090 [Aequorivita sp.]|nr:hypothetical protein [Aequorivita sp.]